MSCHRSVLRVYACTDYPEMVGDIVRGIELVRGTQPGLVGRRNSNRVVAVHSYWKHWPCLRPQHGPGRKHERPIVLAGRQREIVEAHPWPLIRVLIHSDGCRAINRITRNGKRFAYQRYFFSNESADIIGIFCAALDRVGVRWRMCRPNLVSVARRESVAAMDRQIGAKR